MIELCLSKIRQLAIEHLFFKSNMLSIRNSKGNVSLQNEISIISF